MAFIVPAQEGIMGGLTYWVATMPMSMCAKSFTSASKLKDAEGKEIWGDLNLGERYQRLPDYEKIRKQIIPYIADNPDRFFGSLLINIHGGKSEPHFENLEKLTKALPHAYQAQGKKLGFLTVDDDSDLVALDGQHRLLAMQAILERSISYKNKAGTIKSYEVDGNNIGDCLNDIQTVIFIKGNIETSRKIFSSINKNAKATSTNENIMLSEVDGYDIVTRELVDVENGVIDLDMVNYTSNTITDASSHFTSLNVIKNIVNAFVNETMSNNTWKKTIRPDQVEIDAVTNNVKQFISMCIGSIDGFKFLKDGKDHKDYMKNLISNREFNSPQSLLFKPVGQMAFFKGIIKAAQAKDKAGNDIISLGNAIKKANKIDFSVTSKIWDQVMMTSLDSSKPKIMAGKDSQTRVTNLIVWMLCGEKLIDSEIAAIQASYETAKAKGSKLPDPL